MENAVEGLKLAFAVLLLTMALSLTIAFFSKARTTAEMVLRSSDKTVYYDYTSYSIPQDTSGNRIVGYETIIPTLYKYDKERYKVTFKQGNYNETTGELSNVTNLSIYETKSVQANWNKNYVNDFDGETTSTSGHNMNICSFDIVEETQRNESTAAVYHRPYRMDGSVRICVRAQGSALLSVQETGSRSVGAVRRL